jgi:glycosyltransferase involved in cell wall biosynthesis
MDKKRREFRKKYHIDDDTIAIGIIGRIVPIKNLGIFIKGFQEVNKSAKVKTKGLIIGDGAEREKMESYCRELGLRYSSPEQPDPNAPLVFTSWIFDADIAMAGLDIISLTSLNEGTPASLIEAQAAGKPIISTNVGGVSNIVIPDVTALLVPSNDLDAYTKTLRKLVNEPHLRQHLSNEGPEFANRRFNYTRLNEDIRKLYYELLKRAPQKA